MRYTLNETDTLIEKFILCEDDEDRSVLVDDSTSTYSTIENPIVDLLTSLESSLNTLKTNVDNKLDSSKILAAINPAKRSVEQAEARVNNETDSIGSYTNLVGEINNFCNAFDSAIKRFHGGKNIAEISKKVQYIREAAKHIQAGTNVGDAQKIRSSLSKNFSELYRLIKQNFNTDIDKLTRDELTDFQEKLSACIKSCSDVKNMSELAVKTDEKNDYQTFIDSLSSDKNEFLKDFSTKAEFRKAVEIVQNISSALNQITTLHNQLIKERSDKDKSRQAGEWAEESGKWQERLNSLSQPEARQALWDEYFSQSMWSECEEMLKKIRPVVQDEIIKKGWTPESNAFLAYLQKAKANAELKNAINYDGYASIHNAYASSNGRKISNKDLRYGGDDLRDVNIIFNASFFSAGNWSKYLDLQADLIKHKDKEINDEYSMYAEGGKFKKISDFLKKYFLSSDGKKFRSISEISETMTRAFDDFGKKSEANSDVIKNIVGLISNDSDAKLVLDYVAFKSLSLPDFTAIKNKYAATKSKMFIDLSNTTALNRIVTGISLDDYEFNKNSVSILADALAAKFKWTK